MRWRIEELVQARVITSEEIAALESKGKKIKGRREYRRQQSVLLRAKEGKTAEEIGKILNIHPRTVEKHHQRYFEEGLQAFEEKKGSPKGPRLLSAEAEKALLKNLEAKAAQGQLLTGFQIKEEYEREVGRPVALSTIYVVLERNGWSKKHPRPRHPQGDEEAKSLFKKIR
jgi:transposase